MFWGLEFSRIFDGLAKVYSRSCLVKEILCDITLHFSHFLIRYLHIDSTSKGGVKVLSSFNTVPKAAREEFLASILTDQSNRLLEIGYPAIIGQARVRRYLTEIDALWPLVSQLTMRDGYYHPFIIVDPRVPVTRQLIGLQHLLKPREICGLSLANRTFIGTASRIDRTRPYLLVDVDAGLSLCDLDHTEARSIICSQRRIPLTILEGTFLYLNEQRLWKAVGCLASKDAPAFIVFPKSGQGTVYPSCSHILQ
ncbi:MAG: hypothetical protein Q8P71_00410 [bacterium]|nr:hypothetical protein [bacterium]